MEVLSTRIRDHKFPVHFHDTFVIQLITSGADACQCTGLAAASQQVFMHTPFAPHSGGPMGNDSLVYRALYPSLALTEELIGELPKLAPLSLIRECPKLARLIETFDAECPRSSRRQLKQIMLRVVDFAASKNDDAVRWTTHRSCPDLEAARRHLIRHCRRDVSIAELSEVTYLSRFHLIRKFKTHFGITPRQFLVSQRVLMAKRLLAEGIPISTVALEAGFSDQSHLTRCFGRVMGFNPGEFVRG